MTTDQRLICVYASSSSHLEEKYYGSARELGAAMAAEGFGLCFGGGRTGLMGACADAVLETGKPVVGVIPEALNRPGVAHPACTELVVTQTMRQRKQIMEDRSYGFIALPGGFGTFEEILEIITLKQLAYHNKPIVILNSFGYYDALLQQFETAFEQRFAMAEAGTLYHIAQNAAEAVAYMRDYRAPVRSFDKIEAQVLIDARTDGR